MCQSPNLLHLAESNHAILGDELYGPSAAGAQQILALRAVSLAYRDPFTRRQVEINAPIVSFVHEYGFDIPRL